MTFSGGTPRAAVAFMVADAASPKELKLNIRGCKGMQLGLGKKGVKNPQIRFQTLDNIGARKNFRFLIKGMVGKLCEEYKIQALDTVTCQLSNVATFGQSSDREGAMPRLYASDNEDEDDYADYSADYSDDSEDSHDVVG